MKITDIIDLFKEFKTYIFENIENKKRILRFLLIFIMFIFVLWLVLTQFLELLKLLKELDIIKNPVNSIILVFVTTSLITIFLSIIITIYPEISFNKRHKNKFIFFIDEDIDSNTLSSKISLSKMERLSKNIASLFNKYNQIININKIKEVFKNNYISKDNIDFIYNIGEERLKLIPNDYFKFYIKINFKNMDASRWNYFYPSLIFDINFLEKKLIFKKDNKTLHKSDFSYSLSYLERVFKNDFQRVWDDKKDLFQELQDVICYINNINLLLTTITDEDAYKTLRSNTNNYKTFLDNLKFKNYVLNTSKRSFNIVYVFILAYYYDLQFNYDKTFLKYLVDNDLLDNFLGLFQKFLLVEDDIDMYLDVAKDFKVFWILICWIIYYFWKLQILIEKELRDLWIKSDSLDSFKEYYNIKDRMQTLIPKLLMEAYGWAFSRNIINLILLSKRTSLFNWVLDNNDLNLIYKSILFYWWGDKRASTKIFLQTNSNNMKSLIYFSKFIAKFD